MDNITSQLTVESSNILSNLIGTVSPELSQKISLVLNTSLVALGIVMVYFIVLIISKILGWRNAKNLRKISENVEEINNKLDRFLSKKKKN